MSARATRTPSGSEGPAIRNAKPSAKPAAKPAAKPSARRARARAAAPGTVTVRMYHVGFGDAFLLTIPADDRPRRVLIDCGVHASGTVKGQSISDMARQIVADSTDADGTPRIDLVIATHRHQDHVSGFRDEEVWKTVEVQEVWMPWTEDPRDPEARVIRETQSKVAAHLHLALTAQLKLAGVSRAKKLEAQQLLDLVTNSLTNAEAMRTLHGGFGGSPKRVFLPFRTRSANTIRRDFLPGVVVHALGPSRSGSIIRDMNPPKGQSYMRLMDAITDSDSDGHQPFQARWVLDPQQSAYAVALLSDRDRKRVTDVGQGAELGVAVALEQAVNGTSLMLMFEIGRAFLLFPGDAQWGTWDAVLKDPDSRELLTKTTFYKIGHHGSHNATPVEFVEDVLGDGFSAMASVKPVKQWKFIPKAELMTELRKRSPAVVRSDRAEPKEPVEFRRHTRQLGDETVTLWVETDIPI
jgi:beta-lactamase superfamily II metal-dependent hydrolase